MVNNAANGQLPATMLRVPSVFFSDGSGPCYHTTQDEAGIVDFDKLARQADVGYHLARDLATGTKPAIQPLHPRSDEFGDLVGALAPQLGLHPIVDGLKVAQAALEFLGPLETGPCDGFLP